MTPTLSVDPDNQLTGTVAEHFDELQQWMIDRAANVQSQVYAEYPDLNPTVGPPVVGDMNGDRVVDADDAAALMIALTQPLAYIAAYPGVDASTIGDVDGRCTFDLGDLSDFSSLLGPASAESVPEPASAVLLLIAAAMLCGRARRRV